MAHTVARIYEAREGKWAIEFDDGVLLHCATNAIRNDARIEALIADHEERGDDPDLTARMRAMIAAVREHEATL